MEAAQATASPTTTEQAPKKKVTDRYKAERKLAWMLCAPAVIAMLLVTGYPIGYAFYLSLQKFDLRFPDDKEFVGLSNYADVLTSSTWWSDVFVTLFITVVSVSVELVLGMAIALVMHRAIFGRGGVRAAVLIPYGIVTVVAAFTWRFAFDPTVGFVAGLPLVPDDYAPLNNQSGSLFVIILAEVWKTTPFMALLLLAGLALVPDELHEAAKVDGASTTPALRPHHAAADAPGHPGGAAVPHARRLPAVRQRLHHPARRRERHGNGLHPGLQHPDQPAQPRPRLGRVDPDLPLRDPDRGPVRQGARSQHRTADRGSKMSETTGRNKVLWAIGILVVILYALIPVAWIASLSFKTPEEITDRKFFSGFSSENYEAVFSDDTFLAALINSIGIAMIATLISIVLAAMAAYATSRLDFKGKTVILSGALAVAMFPPISIVGSLFEMWRTLGLYDTWLGLIIPYMTFTLPLAIYTLSAFFREIPWELEQAAQVDGATPFQAFRKVIVPLAAPGVFTAAILVFIFAWNDFIFANTLTSTDAARTVPAALAFFTGASQFEQPIGAIAAASVVVTIPIIIMVLIFQRRIVAGLTAGAVKG